MHENALWSAGASAPLRTTPKHVRQPALHIQIRKLSILIPCYNEASTIALVLDKILDVNLSNGIEKEIGRAHV